MNITAIVPFTGDEELVQMTEDCIRQFMACRMPMGVHVKVVAVNNGACRGIRMPVTDNPCFDPPSEHRIVERVGFGPAVNAAIETNGADAYLVMNNDLQFPDPEWFSELLIEGTPGLMVSAPCTDITATPEAVQQGPVDKAPTIIGQVSAYCWLLSAKVTKVLQERFGWPLFSSLFPNYGSDDATAAALRRIYGPRPFRLVHRSWVRHLKGRTTRRFGLKAGDSQVLKQLADWKRKNKLT